MRHRLASTNIIHRNEIDVRTPPGRRPKKVPPNPPKPIDTNPNTHTPDPTEEPF